MRACKKKLFEMRLYGIDGCRGGWVAACRARDSKTVEVQFFPSIIDLKMGEHDLVAIDIPIGLVESGFRSCDHAARKMLPGMQRSSVFYAPVRSVLDCDSYAAGNVVAKKCTGKGMSIQSWNICPKIAEVDHFIRNQANPAAFFEVHPELSFRAWSGSPELEGKKTPRGRELRRALVERYFNVSIEDERAAIGKSKLAEDDLLDAFAALWSLERITRGEEGRVTEETYRDRHGLLMQIRF